MFKDYKVKDISLRDWGLKFHELHMCKPLYDKIIDDKSYKYDTEWYNLNIIL